MGVRRWSFDVYRCAFVIEGVLGAASSSDVGAVSVKFLQWFLLSTFVLVGLAQAFGQDETDLKPLLQKWMRNDPLPSGIVSLATFRKATKFDGSEENVDISFFDLDKRGQKELAVQSGCAAVGNCSLDIYTKAGKSYRKLLTTDMVQVIRPLSASTRGYRDLELRTHGSAFESYHRIFRFDGVRYKRARCWTESYSKIDRGKLQILKKPIITRGCNQDF